MLTLWRVAKALEEEPMALHVLDEIVMADMVLSLTINSDSPKEFSRLQVLRQGRRGGDTLRGRANSSSPTQKQVSQNNNIKQQHGKQDL